MGTIYRNGVPFVGSGGAGGVEMTMAEYELLPESEKMNGAIYFITDGDVSYPSASQMRYDNTESQIPSTTVQGAIDENRIEINELINRFITITSGSIYDITEPGIYYLTSAVTNKPISGGGVYIVGLYNDQTVAGIFVSAYSNEVFQVRQISGTGSYANITVETVRVTGTTSSTGAIDVPTAHRGKRYLNALIATGGAGFVIRRDASYFTVFNNDGTIKANTAVAFDAYFAF